MSNLIKIRTGVWYLPSSDSNIYNDEYIDKYFDYETTDLGNAINNFRINLVLKYTRSTLLDVGIGSGHFVIKRNELMMPTFGWDVPAVRSMEIIPNSFWLNYEDGPISLSFWDSFEHIPNLGGIFKHPHPYIFMTIPIYDGVEENLPNWKHYRPNEHIWYFTANGLVDYMEDFNYALVEERNDETEMGREDIGTYVFRRV